MRQTRGWHERFVGRLRVNVESIPRLPAMAIRWAVEDPRQVPYLFLWRSEYSDKVEEAVRVSLFEGSGAGFVDVKRCDGSRRRLQVVRRPLPQRGSQLLLVCPACNQPRRHLYGWSVRDGRRVTRTDWPCRRCAGLRYQSEGTYIPRHYRFLGGYPRPATWDPWVFSSLEGAIDWFGSSA